MKTAAKLARREGIDFILDPMWATIKDSLFKHFDGLMSQWDSTRKTDNNTIDCNDPEPEP